jgi:hypothetical protein
MSRARTASDHAGTSLVHRHPLRKSADVIVPENSNRCTKMRELDDGPALFLLPDEKVGRDDARRDRKHAECE